MSVIHGLSNVSKVCWTSSFTKNQRIYIIFVIIVTIEFLPCSVANVLDSVKCRDLQLGQYVCQDPVIDATMQAAVGCSPNRLVTVNCMPVPGTVCDGTEHNGTTSAFTREVPCRYTTGYNYNTTLLLSIFLGMFGLDRLYLGYPALALLKFCTVGLLFIGHFLDVILIAMQVVGPADGSDYVLDYYGPALHKSTIDNYTYYMPNTD
ncbi:TM2 domain-containing protein CG10795-like [Asterias rubens]|uniref:TM2 domain-containing protein CG10795-like n=1 Tax=Asterias rubens TaxID=7604 RepID=UPI001454F6CD|nr:TM2 domain-containing protein CG10795-like [Asterias rubens]